MKFYEGLKSVGRIAKLVIEHPIESFFIGSTLLGVGCKLDERLELAPGKQKTNIEFSGNIDTLWVDYGNVDYADSAGKQENYEFMSVVLPNQTMIWMGDFDKNEDMDTYNLFTYGSYVDGDERLEGLTKENCNKIYKSTRKKIKKHNSSWRKLGRTISKYLN
tara:strand:- start:3843 stop:4328 length:486 start_codon:yes stop_codon:yes gene_type:complete